MHAAATGGRYNQESMPKLQFKIIDETADYIVVDKPAFLLTHPTKPDNRTTLWKELRELLAFEIANGGQVSIVNRLDREPADSCWSQKRRRPRDVSAWRCNSSDCTKNMSRLFGTGRSGKGKLSMRRWIDKVNIDNRRSG